MKYIPYGKQDISSEDIQGVVEVLHSEWLTQGPKIDEFEKKIAEYCGAKYAVAVSSGTAALHIACLAIGITHNNEVITSPITFAASANCILYCGGKPVFCDVQKDTININPDEIKKIISNKTKAIIPVHFSGHPCDMIEINQIAKKHKLAIIEDAAHALGSVYRNIKTGSCKFSDMTILSFHPVKHITTGEGGMVLTNKKELYEKLKILRSHGITKAKVRKSKFDGAWFYDQKYLGFNYRITDIQCELGNKQALRLDFFVKKRREIVKKYYQELSDIKDIELIFERPYVKSSWHIFPIRIKRDTKERLRIYNELREKGIQTNVHYKPVYMHSYYISKGYDYTNSCPEAEQYYKETLTLPLFPTLKNEDFIYIIKILKKIL